MEDVSKQMAYYHVEGKGQQQGNLDHFVVDVEKLSLFTTDGINADLDQIPVTVKLQKTLSRKGSQRTAAAAGDGDPFPTSSGAAAAAGPVAHVATPDRPKPIIVVHSPGPAGSAGAPQVSPQMRRRFTARRSGSPPWLDPRRVLLFFATLSITGTVIILYFTLSMGTMTSDGVNYR